jgi:hypothetical protein
MRLSISKSFDLKSLTFFYKTLSSELWGNPNFEAASGRNWIDAMASVGNNRHSESIVRVLPWQRHAFSPQRVGNALQLRFAGGL